MIEKYLAKPLRWLLQQNVSYWHQGLYQFQGSRGNYRLSSVEGKKPGRVIIVSRAHYQEFFNNYPITRTNELKQVLQTEFQSSKYVLHYIGPLDQQQRAVCSIVISEEVVRNFRGSCILVPESVLLWQAQALEKESDQKKIYEINAFSGYFLYCGRSTPVSQGINSFCSDYESFRLNNGVSDRIPCEEMPDHEYANNLVKALSKTLPVFTKLSLLKRSSLDMQAIPLKAMALTVGAISLSYILAVAGYYKLALNERQTEVSQLGSGINHLLDKQKNLKTVSEEANSLVQQRAGKLFSAHIWQLLIGLVQIDSSLQLQNLATEDGRIILRGQANQATDVLAKLQASDLVRDARFDSSVRRQRDKDIFVISIAMAQLQDIQTDTSLAEVVNATQ